MMQLKLQGQIEIALSNLASLDDIGERCFTKELKGIMAKIHGCKIGKIYRKVR